MSSIFVNHGVKVLTCPPELPSADQLMKILVIKMDHRGDFVLALPALQALAEKLRPCELELLTGPWNVEMAHHLGIFSKVYPYEFFKSKSSEAPSVRQDFYDEVLAAMPAYDLAVDLRRSPDTRVFLEKIPAKLKIGYSTRSAQDRIMDICLPQEDDAYSVGNVKLKNIRPSYAQILDIVGVIPDRRGPRIWKKPPGTARKNRGVFFPGAGQEIKQWPVESFIRLGEILRQENLVEGIDVMLSPAEKAFILPFKKEGFEIHEGLGLEELSRKVEESQFLVGNNSFAAHLGGLVGTTVFAIYGGHETALEWQPAFGRNYILFSDLSCSPCHLDRIENCNYDHLCLKQIRPEAVFSFIKSKLSSPP